MARSWSAPKASGPWFVACAPLDLQVVQGLHICFAEFATLPGNLVFVLEVERTHPADMRSKLHQLLF